MHFANNQLLLKSIQNIKKKHTHIKNYNKYYNTKKAYILNLNKT